MNTKSFNPNEITAAFDQLFNGFSDQEKINNDARLIMFRFLDIIERKREAMGWNRKQLAEKVGTSASYITQLFRGDKLINMPTLAKLQKALDLEFEITEKKSYEEIITDYSPINDGKGIWVYYPFDTPNYNLKEELPEPVENPIEVAA